MSPNESVADPDKGTITKAAGSAIDLSGNTKYLVYHPEKTAWTVNDHHVRFIVIVVQYNLLLGLWSQRGWTHNKLRICRAVYELLCYLKISCFTVEDLASDLHDEQARIGKISILYGGTKLHYERALQSHKRHNRQHGYPMFVQRVDVLDGYWTKPAFIHYMILRELRKPESQRLQWLFWFDADTIILNYNVPLEIFLPPEDHEGLRNINILISDDWNGLNNGIFGIRVSRYAAELFAGILAFRDFEPDTQLVFQDQSAMEILLKRRKSINHVAKVPQRWFNAYATDDERPGSSYVHPGDFLVHFAGTGSRDIKMNKWADKSEQLNYKWNTPLTHLKLPDEVQRFWNRTQSVWDARQNHWVKGTKQIQATIFNVNITLNEWRTTPQNESNNFLSLAKAQETAEYFIGNSTKYNGEIIKEDLHQLGKIVMELEN
ncbi:hypothetical protein E4U59_002986, partial [Claviceps monticola]